jgi:phage-related protein
MGERRWRDYRTRSGRRPVRDFIDSLSDEDAAAVVAAMKEVRADGLVAARHLEGEIYEVRVDGNRVIYRVLFASQGKRGQILLSLQAIKKKTQKTPVQSIRLAKRRLRDWQEQGEEQNEKRMRRLSHS